MHPVPSSKLGTTFYAVRCVMVRKFSPYYFNGCGQKYTNPSLLRTKSTQPHLTRRSSPSLRLPI